MIDPDDGRSYYTAEAVMALSPADYVAWVYSARTARVNEVRLYKDKRVNKLLNSWPVWLPHVIWIPAALWIAAPFTMQRIVAMICGFFLWPLLEVFFHRFVFHMPVRNKIAQRMHITFHGSHHLAPNDAGRLTSHPLLITAYSGVIFGLLSLAHAPLPDAIVAGLLMSYIRCDTTHVLTHLVSFKRLQRVPVIGAFLVRCKRYHYDHHFVDAHSRFAISFYWPS